MNNNNTSNPFQNLGWGDNTSSFPPFNDNQLAESTWGDSTVYDKFYNKPFVQDPEITRRDSLIAAQQLTIADLQIKIRELENLIAAGIKLEEKEDIQDVLKINKI